CSAFVRLRVLGILKVVKCEAVLRLNMHDGLRNLHGKLHGGALFSLIDTTMSQSSHSLNDGVPYTVTLECKVNYIRSVSDGELLCRAWVVHGGRRTQVIEADVHQGDKLVAKAQATFACL